MAGRQSLEINEEQVKAWVIATKRDGISWASLSRASGFSAPLIKGRVARFLEMNPGFLETLVAAAPPADDQMDDPELMVAAAPEPPPADEDVAALARQRTRELHARQQMVISAQPLTPSVFARKHPDYVAPRIVQSGSLFEENPHAAAKTIEEMVARLNTVPGFEAYFEWRTSGSVGQPLGA